MVVRLLVRGHLRTRWKRYGLVALSFGLGLFAFFLVVMVTDGARVALVRPIGDTLTGDVRVTNRTQDLAGGSTWTDFRPLAAELGRIPGAQVSPRLESNYITIRGAEYDNWSAGLLLGIEPDDPAEAKALGRYMIWGRPLAGLDVFDPTDRARVYTPIVLGQPAIKRLNLTLNATGLPDFNQVLTLTSGRLMVEGNFQVPITIECVVVGVFKTGLEPLDKFTAYVPLHKARYLAGHHEGDPVANALVVHGGDEAQVTRVAQSHEGTKAVTAQEFAFTYMGSLLLVLYVAAYFGLALFFGVLIVWLLHESGVLVRNDQAVLSSLRAIGISPRDIYRSYAALTTAAVGAGAAAALLVALLLSFVAPPIAWSTSGLTAVIPWRAHPLAILAVGAAAVLASLIGSWGTARRVQQLNILEGLRGA